MHSKISFITISYFLFHMVPVNCNCPRFVGYTYYANLKTSLLTSLESNRFHDYKDENIYIAWPSCEAGHLWLLKSYGLCQSSFGFFSLKETGQAFKNNVHSTPKGVGLHKVRNNELLTYAIDMLIPSPPYGRLQV